MRPHRQQPTRLPRSWDSPGKNTGVGCHFLLQCMKVKSESEVAQSYLTLSDPMNCSLPGSSVHGIFQARVLEWGATAFSYRRPFLKSQLKSEIWEATSSHSMTLLQMFHFFLDLISLFFSAAFPPYNLPHFSFVMREKGERKSRKKRL